MAYPSILSIGTAVPDARYGQMHICEQLLPAFDNSHRAPAVFRATDIDGRHSVVDELDWLVANPSNGERMVAYMTHALPLGVRAIEQALGAVSWTAAEIDHLILASCTGVDCPGLDVRIAETLGMSSYLRRATIVGMGCQALLPSLYQASNTVQIRPEARVLVLTLELCTLHFQHGRTLKNMLGSALFADGASAVVIGNGNRPGPQLLDSMTFSDYQSQAEMAFHPGDTGYQIILSGKIPKLIGARIGYLMDRFLGPHGLQVEDINHWVVHPGGMAILDQVQQQLELPETALDHSRAVLRQYGNMSSATLLFVLRRTIEQSQPAAGDYGILLGFGPGLTIELGLLRW
jgi:predicted naringenin-chalcone synthase